MFCSVVRNLSVSLRSFVLQSKTTRSLALGCVLLPAVLSGSTSSLLKRHSQPLPVSTQRYVNGHFYLYYQPVNPGDVTTSYSGGAVTDYLGNRIPVTLDYVGGNILDYSNHTIGFIYSSGN